MAAGDAGARNLAEARSGADLPERVLNFPVLRKLGEGSTAEVYLCHDEFHGREVAVKRFRPEALQDPERGSVFRKRFLSEAALVGKLAHPHIVQIHDAVTDERTAYVVMEYVPGGTLERFARPGALLSLDKSVEIIFKCTRALAFARALGVIHRDMKPGNILCANSPTDIRISDFGLALHVNAEFSQITGLGSPAYMSPEQLREEPLDQRTDIYSLGVVMFKLLTGRLPYHADNNASLIYQITQLDAPPPSALRRDVPMALDRIVRRAMHRDLARRYPNWEEFARDLGEAFRTHRMSPRFGERGEADQFSALRAMPVFRRFSDPELWEVVAIGTWEDVAAGTALMREGESGDAFYVLAAGEAKVTKKKKLLSVLGPGSCCGEMAYLSETGNARSATVTVSADASVLRVRVADLKRASPACRAKFDRAFMSLLVERLHLTNTRLAG